MSLAVVGGLHLNNDGSNRLFEIALCLPGEPVSLVCEPRNLVDPNAVAVFSVRGAQLGYLPAERSGWIGARISQGEDFRAIFQQASSGVAVIQVSFSGAPPASRDTIRRCPATCRGRRWILSRRHTRRRLGVIAALMMAFPPASIWQVRRIDRRASYQGPCRISLGVAHVSAKTHFRPLRASLPLLYFGPSFTLTNGRFTLSVDPVERHGAVGRCATSS